MGGFHSSPQIPACSQTGEPEVGGCCGPVETDPRPDRCWSNSPALLPQAHGQMMNAVCLSSWLQPQASQGKPTGPSLWAAQTQILPARVWVPCASLPAPQPCFPQLPPALRLKAVVTLSVGFPPLSLFRDGMAFLC